jgi:hypothetical protein
MHVRVCIPHFFREEEGGSGYGSGRQGARFERCLALYRCLSALIALGRGQQDLVLNIGRRWLDETGPLRLGMEEVLPAIELELNLFTTGDHALHEVIEPFSGTVTRHRLDLEDPRQLPLATRDFLIAQQPTADLALYLEDDLVIADPLFLDKQWWFLEGCGASSVLMPHRYELIPGGKGQRLLVDGPLRDQYIGRFTRPRAAEARGRFRGEEVIFDRTANPHSGLSCLHRRQVERLQGENLPYEGFIGPLETAATLTALRFFPVYKPSFKDRAFLWVEHGHPSFSAYARSWPRKEVSTPPPPQIEERFFPQYIE